MGGLLTYASAEHVDVTRLDPFLFINQHGPEAFAPDNPGLPFAPHPHRGFETLTFILAGDVVHRDSTGMESCIGPGGVQWMTAGSGIIHEEVSSESFKRNGGWLDVLQLWMNLPSALKFSEPNYQGLQRDALPTVPSTSGDGSIQLVSGEWRAGAGPETERGPATAPRPLSIAIAHLGEGDTWSVPVPDGHGILCYVAGGSLRINGETVRDQQLVVFEDGAGNVEVEGLEGRPHDEHGEAHREAILIFGHGQPIEEQIAAYGPFVMTTREEVIEAHRDLQMGTFVKGESQLAL